MRSFRCLHHTGTEAIIANTSKVGPSRSIFARLAGFLVETSEHAKALADNNELSKHGHLCNPACKGWWVPGS
jgi:hypothetical protein